MLGGLGLLVQQLTVSFRHSDLRCVPGPQPQISPRGRKATENNRIQAGQRRTSRDQAFRPGRPLKSADAAVSGEVAEQLEEVAEETGDAAVQQEQSQPFAPFQSGSHSVRQQAAGSLSMESQPEKEDTFHSTEQFADGAASQPLLDLASLALPKLGSLRPIRTASVAQDAGPEELHSQNSNLTYGLEPGSAGRGRTARPRCDSSPDSASTAGTPRHRSRRNSLAAANSEGPWGNLLTGPVSRLSRGISILQSQAGDETPTRGGRSMSPKLRGVFAEFAVKVDI